MEISVREKMYIFQSTCKKSNEVCTYTHEFRIILNYFTVHTRSFDYACDKRKNSVDLFGKVRGNLRENSHVGRKVENRKGEANQDSRWWSGGSRQFLLFYQREF